MCCMVGVHILDGKILHYEYKHNRLPAVVPEARCDGALEIAMAMELVGQEVVG